MNEYQEIEFIDENGKVFVAEKDDGELVLNELTVYNYDVRHEFSEEYFVGYQISALLGYKNPAEVIKKNVSKCNQIEFRDLPDEIKKPQLDPRVILINRDGAIEILIKTRKRISPDVLHILKSFGIDTTNRKCLTKEQQTLSALTNTFKTEKFEDQFKVGRYYLDLYFPEYKIVVECDENGHADRKPYKERERMDFVNEKLGLTDDNWIRFNPDEKDFDVSKVSGRIYTRINLLKSVQIQDLLQQHQTQMISLPAPDSDDIISTSERSKTAPRKLCGKCNLKLSVRKFYLRGENPDFVLQEPADGNKYTEDEIIEIQSKYRSSCKKCCNKKSTEVRNTLKKDPNFNKSDCKSCNTIFKNDFFYINEDKTVFDECIVCYIKNNNLPESKQCIDCLKILPLSGYHVHTGTVLRNQCKTCRNTKKQQARKSVICEFCNAEIKHKENLAPHQETESCKKSRNLIFIS